MVSFTAILQKFDSQGEKTGWTYIDIPADIAHQLKPNFKRSFRIKGTINNYAFNAAAVLPMGGGDYIFAINSTIRKKIRRQKGDTVELHLEEDTTPIPLSSDLMVCLEEDAEAKTFFESLPKSHQHYFSKWIESAKTDATKAKRIAQAINAFSKKMGYAEMLRANKNSKF